MVGYQHLGHNNLEGLAHQHIPVIAKIKQKHEPAPLTSHMHCVCKLGLEFVHVCVYLATAYTIAYWPRRSTGTFLAFAAFNWTVYWPTFVSDRSTDTV